MELRNEVAKDKAVELASDALEGASGGIQGNHEIPDGFKRVCAICGSENVHYSRGMGGFPVCFDCESSEYNFVPV